MDSKAKQRQVTISIQSVEREIKTLQGSQSKNMETLKITPQLQSTVNCSYFPDNGHFEKTNFFH